MLCWLLCVCVHEFAHALVAYWGGDRSVREKGYLSLDPTKFIDPIFSLLVPAIILMMGGIPLPGGSVRIDRAALKSRNWAVGMSAAGPISNFVLFLLFALPLHPALGIVDRFADGQPTWVYFCGAMATLNFIGTLFNLIPCPPLDGYHMIEHKLPWELQNALRQPQARWACLRCSFLIFMSVDQAMYPFLWMLVKVCSALGLPVDLLISGYSVVLFNQSP
ncbi:MAG: site-2 protease family protein [Planctomycetes bacterium]|nr:site-2 protease family protein [Planctomycetota bacterium]